MNDRQWQEAWEIFRTARDLSADELRSYLDSVQTDPDILQEVVLMLEEPPEESPPEPASRIGTRLGRYEMIAILGSGGMGEVYSARDMELGRMVALKFLAPEMAASRPAMDRLVREAKAASALNHPHIVTVYEVIRKEDDIALAMELVEGKALRDFCGNPLGISRFIQWGGQIAQALAAAHERSIIHRDIKPENLMVRQDGMVKVLDFGLARETAAVSRGPLTNSSHGLAGTLRYMSPEQVHGRAATSASDVFSLGIVLFELATGAHPFRRDSPIDTAHAIAHAAPKHPSALRPDLPSPLSALLLAMLDKDPDRRPAASEVAAKLQLVRIDAEPGSNAARGPQMWLGAAAIAALIALAGTLWFGFRDKNRTVTHADLRVQPLTSQPGWETSPSVSPDGDAVAFNWSAGLDSPKQIYLKRLSTDTIIKLTDAEDEGEVGPMVWSPDGRQIAFKRRYIRSGAIFTISSVGGDEQKITELATGDPTSSIDWSPDGTQLAFSDHPPGSGRPVIYLFNLTTGEKRKLTSPPADVWGDWDPKFAPDGGTIAFKRVTGFWLDDIYTVPVAGETLKRITNRRRGIWGHTWSSDGTDLIVSTQANGTVFGIWRFPIADPERPERLTIIGADAITPATGRRTERMAWVNQTEDLNIHRVASTGAGSSEKLIASMLRDFTAKYSPDGRIAFVSDRSGTAELWLSDGDGGGQVRVPTLKDAVIGGLAWSPDARQIAFSAWVSGKPDIFLLDCEPNALSCGKPRQFTTEPSSEAAPNWSGDGRFLYFTSDRTGRDEIWRQPISEGPPVQVTRNGGYTSYESSDGQWLYFSQWTGERIWRIPGSQSPRRERDVSPELVIGPPYRVRPAWTLTPDEIFFVDPPHQRSAVIRAYDLATRRVRTILELKEIFAHRADIEVSLSPDRRWLLYTQLDRSGSNIMVTEERR